MMDLRLDKDNPVFMKGLQKVYTCLEDEQSGRGGGGGGEVYSQMQSVMNMQRTGSSC